jgi:PAS domain S-box-containing protein
MNSRARLALALLLPFLAAGVQWLLWDAWIKPYAWLLFFPAAFFSASLGGLSGGVASTVIGALLAWFVFITPQFSFELQNPSAAFSLMVFVVMGGLFAWFHEQLQRTLKSSKYRFEATFERAPVGIALATPEGRFLRVSPKLCEITGYTAAEMTAMSFQDITHPSDLETDLANVRRTLAGEIGHFPREKRYVRKDGRIVWVRLTVSLVRKRNHTPDYFIAVIEDIKSAKQAEQRFTQLFEQAPVALATSNREGRILLMNQAFIEIFGYRIEDTPTVEEWRARALSDREQRAAATIDWNVEWQAGNHRSEMVEHPVTCRDGRRRTVLLSRQQLGDEVMLAAIDISIRKAAEDEARQHIDELERFHRASVGRELDMIKLKREVNALAQELGRAPPYDLGFADAPYATGQAP